MAITLTEAAASRVKQFLDKRGKGMGLRLGVKTTGCSGMAYVIEYADAIEEGDTVFEDHGVKVIISPKSLVYLDGTELFCVVSIIKDGIDFFTPKLGENPLVLQDGLFKRPALVPDLPGRILNHGIGFLSGRPLFDQPQEQTLRKDHAPAPFEILKHPVLVNVQTFQNKGHHVQHVIKQNGAVRKNDPFHG